MLYILVHSIIIIKYREYTSNYYRLQPQPPPPQPPLNQPPQLNQLDPEDLGGTV